MLFLSTTLGDQANVIRGLVTLHAHVAKARHCAHSPEDRQRVLDAEAAEADALAHARRWDAAAARAALRAGNDCLRPDSAVAAGPSR